MKPPLQDQEFALRGCAVIICAAFGFGFILLTYGAVATVKWLLR